MRTKESANSENGVWFIYDGECPICHYAAHALRIREAAGTLRLVDAREEIDHPLLAEVNALGLNLDESMVLKYGGRFYCGPDALELMALLGTGVGWFNRMNALLFRSKPVARFCYPIFRAGRNVLIHVRGVPKIRNLDKKEPDKPIFASILGESWDNLPPVMQAHYAVKPNSNDLVVAKGWLDVSMAWPLRVACRITRMLVPYNGRRVPVTVSFTANGNCFCFDRAFAFPERPIYHFRSQMQPVGGNEVIEWMRYSFGWRCAYGWDGKKVILSHRGYVWRVKGIVLSVPLHWFIGKGYAEEHPLTDTTFSMWTHTKHPLFGELFRYGGEFEVIDAQS